MGPGRSEETKAEEGFEKAKGDRRERPKIVESPRTKATEGSGLKDKFRK